MALAAIRRWLGARPVPAWYHPAYRLPATTAALDRRRADNALWALGQRADVRTPSRIGYADLARVHTQKYLDSLQDPATLARIFALEVAEVPVDALLGLVRLACGGTLEAARAALAARAPALNLLGGFHHAGPARGGGLCAANDVAVAIAVLRAEGFAGRVCVLDLDAHPPDGTAECLAGNAKAWIGSLSGADWGPIGGTVDETLLPAGCGDDAYARALEALLGRMPRPALAFVIAGGDVLAGDRLGRLGLTLDGARRRDVMVARALAGRASVWLPGGGYHPDAWKVLAGTGLVLAGRARQPVGQGDPVAGQIAAIAGTIDGPRLGGDAGLLDLGDLGAELAGAPPAPRLLDYYTTEGLEYALERYGVLEVLGRLGYGDFRGVIDVRAGVGTRARLFGTAAGLEHLLIECALERRRVADVPCVYVHWLSLRNPRATFVRRAPLPGQDVPGLGLAREIVELLERMALRLGLGGVAFRPAWYHTAYAARHRFRFVDAERQGRFEALCRDLAALDLPAATRAVAEGRVHLGAAVYVWEPDVMLARVGAEVEADEAFAARAAAERERTRFTIAARSP